MKVNQDLHKIFCHNMMFAKRNCAWRRLYFDYDSSSFFQQKMFLSKYVCSENPKKRKYSAKMSRAFPYETVYKVTLDNFILIARLRQNANFSSLVCSSALFCLFHVGEKITNYVPADYRSFSLFEFLEFQAQNFKSHLLSTFHC